MTIHSDPTVTRVSAQNARADFVFLHGYDMEPEGFAAFARSMKLPADVHLPRGSNHLSDGRFSWWPVDANAREEELLIGPRDFADRHPDRGDAREALRSSIEVVRAATPVRRPLFLGGFSQGAMLACDAVLQGEVQVDGLILLSACRVAIDEWEQSPVCVEGLPILLAHGYQDRNISFNAGRALADFLRSRRANVEWVEFDGGHETPLPVWRAVRRLILGELANR